MWQVNEILTRCTKNRSTIRTTSNRLSRCVTHDHLHVALRANIEHSPEEIAVSFQNNLTFMLRKGAIWRPGYYVGTFGEYNMNAIRRAVRLESDSPAGQAGRGPAWALSFGRPSVS